MLDKLRQPWVLFRHAWRRCVTLCEAKSCMIRALRCKCRILQLGMQMKGQQSSGNVLHKTAVCTRTKNPSTGCGPKHLVYFCAALIHITESLDNVSQICILTVSTQQIMLPAVVTPKRHREPQGKQSAAYSHRTMAGQTHAKDQQS